MANSRNSPGSRRDSRRSLHSRRMCSYWRSWPENLEVGLPDQAGAAGRPVPPAHTALHARGGDGPELAAVSAFVRIVALDADSAMKVHSLHTLHELASRLTRVRRNHDVAAAWETRVIRAFIDEHPVAGIQRWEHRTARNRETPEAADDAVCERGGRGDDSGGEQDWSDAVHAPILHLGRCHCQTVPHSLFRNRGPRR